MTSSICIAVAETYKKTASKLREINALAGIRGLISWDELTMLPEGSSALRGRQKSVLSGVIYDKETDPELGALLRELSANTESLSDVQRAVVRDALKTYIQLTTLPKELVTRQSELETEGYTAWVEARRTSDFKKFSPILKEWVALLRKKAELIDPTKPAYDVLLDQFEKGMTQARLDEIFTEVRSGLVPFIQTVKAKGTPPDDSIFKGKFFDVELQAKLSREIALDIGFNISQGRLDVSVHPFTGGAGPNDVRMTTRFKADDITEGLTGTIHETGHALYEQGRNLAEEWDGLPVNEAMSMGIHESQSLLWERAVALQRPFQNYLLAKLKAVFPDKFGIEATPEVLYGAMNKIKDPSMIRVESDEVTYTMHVILRYELEKGLIDGSIEVDDIPRLWNEKMVQYLGTCPSNDAEGCLQDVHWSGGALGYFPTYSLGAMYAAQIYSFASQNVPDLETKISNGEFSPLKSWLNEKIHKLGSLYASGDELMTAVTGKPLDPQVFLSYLKNKYTDVYKF